MSLDKQREARAKWIEKNMPAESMDPPFPYISMRIILGLGTFLSPSGFVPNYYKAHNSIGGLPEALQKDEE